MSGPNPGDVAPAFEMAASGGRQVSSAALKGTPYLLYFYPKADTPGCTKQACGIQEALPALGKLKLTVIGVSPDAMPPIEKFAKKYNLEFPLASDPAQVTAQAYGVWVEKSMYGKQYMGVARTTFIIDEKGIITDIIEKVDTKNHSSQIH